MVNFSRQKADGDFEVFFDLCLELSASPGACRFSPAGVGSVFLAERTVRVLIENPNSAYAREIYFDLYTPPIFKRLD